MARPTGLRWVGPVDHRGMPKAWVTGIPARSLNADDIAQLDDEQVAAALASGLYEGPAKPAKAAATTPGPVAAQDAAGGEG